jgi:hypothetical protein
MKKWVGGLSPTPNNFFKRDNVEVVVLTSGIVLGGICIIVAKIFSEYLFADSCEGDGNFRYPMDYYDHEIEDEPEIPDVEYDDSSKKDSTTIKNISDEINKLKKQLKG